MEQQKKKRTGLVIALVACLALVGVAGVMAWYSSTSEITNNFVDGGITEPGTDPTNPNKPLKPEVTPDPEHNGHQGQVNGNIVENQWIVNSKVTPGSSIPKNPNVGIGKNSDSCYVFVNVKNNFTSGAHFTLNNGWKAVEATQYKGQANEYTGGLFVYVGKDVAVNSGDAAILTANPTADSWTGEVFSKVKFDADAVLGDSKSIKVSAYLVAASNKTEQINTTEITEAAKAWANKR